MWRKSEIVRDGERDRKRNVDIEQDSVATGVSFLSYVLLMFFLRFLFVSKKKINKFLFFCIVNFDYNVFFCVLNYSY